MWKSKSALDYAMAENNTLLIERLLKNGAIVHPQRIGRIHEFDEAVQLCIASSMTFDLLHDSLVRLSECHGVPNGFDTVLELLLRCEPSKHPFCEAARNGALLLAAQGGDIWSMRLLLGAGADVNACGVEDLTPLMLASAGGQVLAVSVLLQCGADPNLRDFYGETALTLALQRKRGEIAALLVKNRADVSVTVAHDGSTPLKIAWRMGMPLMYLKLRRAGAKA